MAVSRAQAIGAKTIQIFGSSPRQWKFRLPSPEGASAFRRAVGEAGIRPVFLHAPYLINLAAYDEVIRAKSTELLAGTLKIAEALDAKGVIFHIGSASPAKVSTAAGSTEMPLALARKSVVAELRTILKNIPGKSALILENSAGGGDKLGADLAEIGGMMDELGSERVLACFDTAHAFEAGIVGDYSPEAVQALAETIGRTIRWERLAAIHANDSKTVWNSHSDRHENIGEGYIGKEGFRNLFRDPKFRAAPWLLEVPGMNDEGPDKENVDILRELAGVVK